MNEIFASVLKYIATTMARFNPSVHHSIFRLWRQFLYIGVLLSILGSIKNCKCEYWNNPSSGYGNVNENFCLSTQQKLHATTERFIEIQDTLLGLDSIGCQTEKEDCSKIIFLSQGGPAGLRHPAIFGIYDLDTISEEYPAYVRHISGQYMFYKANYEHWDYSHKIERWVVGPERGIAHGGIMILSQKKCPWDIAFGFGRMEETMYFYDKQMPNTWSQRGNGWSIDNDVSITCYNKTEIPKYRCACEKFNVTGKDTRISEYHKETLGIYTRVRNADDGFTTPVYKKDANIGGSSTDMFLYSHHPSGHLWMVGRTLTSWSLRLNYLTYMKTLLAKNKKDKKGPAYLGTLSHVMCPTNRKQKEEDAQEDDSVTKGITYPKWEYLQSKKGQDEIWLKDDIFDFVCIP